LDEFLFPNREGNGGVLRVEESSTVIMTTNDPEEFLHHTVGIPPSDGGIPPSSLEEFGGIPQGECISVLGRGSKAKCHMERKKLAMPACACKEFFRYSSSMRWASLFPRKARKATFFTQQVSSITRGGSGTRPRAACGV
jgi:hypothetical protein